MKGFEFKRETTLWKEMGRILGGCGRKWFEVLLNKKDVNVEKMLWKKRCLRDDGGWWSVSCEKWKLAEKRCYLFFNKKLEKTTIAKIVQKQMIFTKNKCFTKEWYLQGFQLKTLIGNWEKLSGDKINREFYDDEKKNDHKGQKDAKKLIKIQTELFKEGTILKTRWLNELYQQKCWTKWDLISAEKRCTGEDV